LGGDGVITLDAARRADYVRLIRKSSQHLLQVVNDLLDMSKIEAGKLAISPEPVAVKPLVEGCAELLSQQALERGVTIRTEVSADLPDLIADPRACRQILLNLIANAVKFSKTGGEVMVSAHRFGSTYLFRVADHGIGIAEGDLKRLGTPFFQADSAYNRQYQGTGLGLSVVKGLAALHGGDISIESKLGSGTVVTVKLPSDCGDAALRSGFTMPVEERKSA
jgi:cell cycle sensor histidine kinase DivJ